LFCRPGQFYWRVTAMEFKDAFERAFEAGRGFCPGHPFWCGPGTVAGRRWTGRIKEQRVEKERFIIKLEQAQIKGIGIDDAHAERTD